MPVPRERAVVLPQIGAGADPVQVAAWLVYEGEHVASGERLVEVTVHGICFAVAAPWEGRLGRVNVPTGGGVSEGDVLGWIEVDDRHTNGAAEDGTGDRDDESGANER